MKNCLLAILLIAASLAHAGVKIEHWIAPSGARVFFVESHVLPIIDIQLDFAAGSAFDPPGKSGVAGLTRGLLDAGTAELDEEMIAGRLVDSGAQLSGHGDLDRAGLSLRTLSSQAERRAAVELLRQVLQTPTFPQPVLEREKARSIASIKEADTRPDSIAAKRFGAALYADHPYGRQTTVDSVSAIGRDDLLSFYRTHYSARRAVVSIIGDLPRAEAEALAQNLTAMLPAEVNVASLPKVEPPARNTLRIDHPATQSHIYIGMPAMRRGDPDFFPLLVGNYVLGGGGFVSRLTQEVREKRGYAYSVYSYFQPLQLEGPFQIGLQTKREQAAAALQVVEQTLSGFLHDGPSAKELKLARQNIADGFALRLDSNRKILDHVAVIGFYDLPLDYLDSYQRKVSEVTTAQVRDAFARRIKPENLVTVIVAGD